MGCTLPTGTPEAKAEAEASLDGLGSEDTAGKAECFKKPWPISCIWRAFGPKRCERRCKIFFGKRLLGRWIVGPIQTQPFRFLLPFHGFAFHLK